MKQIIGSQAGSERKKRITRREHFLVEMVEMVEMEQVMP